MRDYRRDRGVDEADVEAVGIHRRIVPLEHEREPGLVGEYRDRGGAIVGSANEVEVVDEERGERLNVVGLEIEVIELQGV